ncbi:MAG: hypothetical protein H7Z38_08455 [Rubrivivax sp.]|nr:hypothetical protein [Pyrinomonadaceae bacterium]
MLPPTLARHFKKEAGSFSPFTYSIGMDASLQESLDALQEYPLPQPLSDDALDKFSRALTFLHESVHLAQYVSSAFGLRALRHTLICNRYLVEGADWRLPVGRTLLEMEPGSWTEHQAKAFGRLLTMLNTADQLRLHYKVMDIGAKAEVGIHVIWEPWTPLFFTDATPADWDEREKMMAGLEGVGVQRHRIPNLVFNAGERADVIVLNAAALMEGFALVLELNQIFNAGIFSTLDNIQELMSVGNEYMAPIWYGLGRGSFDVAAMIPTMAVCVDVALMYDPFVLFNATTLDAAKEGEKSDQNPGETFIKACDAAANIRPVESNEPGEISRFYAELCEEMKLPSPQWMAERSFEVASSLMASVPGALEDIWLGKALRMHTEALKYRCERPYTLAFELLSHSGLSEMTRRCAPYVSFYRLKTHQPEHFNPGNVDLVTLFNLIVQALTESSIDCPLKMGEPFYCPSALSDTNTLCVFVDPHSGEQMGECLLDLAEKYWGILYR